MGIELISRIMNGKENKILILVGTVIVIFVGFKTYQGVSYASQTKAAINEYSDKTDPAEKKTTSTNKENLKLLSWNLDGLDTKDLEERTAAVVEHIHLKKPDLVLLQEVVAYSLKIFQDKCQGYIALPGNHTFNYFNAILVRTSSVLTKPSLLKSVPFETSKLGRYYLIQPIQFADSKIVVMTSHFESFSENGAERKKQFSEILDYMKRQSKYLNVIFGGDTNLRDPEFKAVGGLSGGVLDAWESCGSALTTKYTWNMAENDNRQKKHPKLRVDRIFVRPAKEAKAVKPSSFTLVGKERLKGCKRFVSDHWGVWLEFGIH